MGILANSLEGLCGKYDEEDISIEMTKIFTLVISGL
jgi:hypothetical protein